MSGSNESNKVIVAANPVSGQRGNRRLVERLSAALIAGGLEPRVIWDQVERKALLSQADLSEGYRCVIVAGGDGTVGDVLNEQPALPLAVAPLGTENLFAREFGFTRDMERLAQAVRRCDCRTIDLGLVNGRRFSLMVSAGFDSEVVRRATLARRRHGVCVGRGGRAAFFGPALSTLFRYRYPRVRLEADGQTWEGAHVFIFNVHQYAMDLKFVPDARSDDGMLDWLVMERPGLRRLIGYFMAVRGGRCHTRPDVRHGRARKIRITSLEPVPLQVDGDAGGWVPAEVGILPSTVRLVKCG